jgi:hypothetical protein
MSFLDTNAAFVKKKEKKINLSAAINLALSMYIQLNLAYAHLKGPCTHIVYFLVDGDHRVWVCVYFPGNTYKYTANSANG